MMSGYFSDTYLDNLQPVLLDYITNSGRGQSVPDVPLSFANRAMRNIWAKKPWCDLATDITINLSTGSFTFPADYGRIVSIWADLDGTGVQSYWYYDGGDYARGYKLRDSFTKDTGHEWTISFYSPQSTPVYMVYQRLLADLTGVGKEYLFFPSNLMLLECQKIYLREKGDLKEYQAVSMAFDEEFKDYCNAHQWINYDASPRINDRDGNIINVEQYTLDGSRFGRNTGSQNNALPY